MVHGQDKYTGTLDWNSNSRNCHAIILAHLVVSSDQLQQGSMLIVGALFGGGGHMCIQHHHTTLLTIIHIPDTNIGLEHIMNTVELPFKGHP